MSVDVPQEDRGLPAAWAAALRYCPFCSGTGYRDRSPEDACGHCRGSGDLFGAMLQRAYEEGRNDALGVLREVFKHLSLSGRAVAALDVQPAELKRRIGL